MTATGLRCGVEVEFTQQALVAAAEAALEQGAVDDAIASLRAAAALRDDAKILNQLCNLLFAAGRYQESLPYRSRFNAVISRSLPDRLADGLAKIWREPTDISLDEAAVEWAWECADQTVWEKDEWRAAAGRGTEACLLVRDWWEAAAPDRLTEIMDLIDPPDVSAFLGASIDRNGPFLAGAHVGPSTAGVCFFSMGNRSFKTIGAAFRNRSGDETLIPLMSNPVNALRATLQHLGRDSIIGVTADAKPRDREYFSAEFLGREIRLPLLAPKLIYKYRAASFWCCPLWRNKRIVIELEQLPDPEPRETREAWSQRWFAAYLRHLGAVMRGPPENLSLFSGIWSNVSRSTPQKDHFLRRTATGAVDQGQVANA